MSYKIVVARYNENIDWFESEMINCVIYNKGEPLHIENEILRENVGRESETYLHYIISNYDNLPDIVLFTQANISDHPYHGEKNDINYLFHLIKQARENGKSNAYIHHESNHIDEWYCWDSDWNKLWDGTYFLKDNHLNNIPMIFTDWFKHNIHSDYPDPFHVYMNGIFAVKKELILANSVDYYRKLLSTVNHHVNPTEGHFLERSWYYIFTSIEKKTIKNNLVVFLTQHFHSEFIKTLMKMDTHKYMYTADLDVVVLVDSCCQYDDDINRLFNHIKIIKVDIGKENKQTSYHSSIHSMYIQYFKENYNFIERYNYIWMIESDVYYPDNFIDFINIYQSYKYDLLVSEYGLRDLNWCWTFTLQGFKKKYNIGVMAAIIRMSQKLLLKLIDNIDTTYFGFVEAILPHICMENNLSIQQFLPETCGSMTVNVDSEMSKLIATDIKNKTRVHVENKIYYPIINPNPILCKFYKNLEKNIFILWLQGWKSAGWLNKQVVESWKINNPDWTVHLIDLKNLKKYVTDIDYIYDKKKTITPAAKSDIIRLSLLKNHGGIWADATMLCMQPLDHWVHEAVSPSDLWMYHGHGAGMSKEVGPASWFIVSKKNGYMISKWKEECDCYWNSNNDTNNYFWMDSLFLKSFETDEVFNQLWLKVPYLYCELDGQSHTLAHHGMDKDTPHLKRLFLEKPPYAIKFWKHWADIFPDATSEKCLQSNGYYAIQLSKRKYTYRHIMT